MVDVPALIDLTEWSTPQIRLRRWAGEHGEKHGLTHFTKNDDKGRPEYAETPEQNAFRHAFVAAAKYLDNRAIADHDPFGGSAGREDEIAASNVIRLGFLNEWYAANSLGHHLQDYWNNYEGVKLGREVADQIGTDISNDELAKYVAEKIKS